MTDFNKIFQNLWHTPENELVEFKEAKESFDIDDLGKYFSALSNEANLRGMDFGWLIFGVNDKTRLIVGTNFKNGEKALNKLKNDMSQHTTGNHKMFSNQRERFFPMPDYLIDKEKCEVTVVIYGKAIDERYTRLLKENHDLTLKECIWLDAVQKHRPVTEDALKALKKRSLIEGHSSHYIISLGVAQATNQLPQYNQSKGLEKGRLVQMVEQFIASGSSKGVTRKEMMDYVSIALPSNRTYEQKNRLLSNLLVEMKAKGRIYSINRHWFMTKKSEF